MRPRRKGDRPTSQLGDGAMGLGAVKLADMEEYVRTVTALLRGDIDAAFAEYGRLIAKPSRDGSSYGLIFVCGLLAGAALIALTGGVEKPITNAVSGLLFVTLVLVPWWLALRSSTLLHA